MFRVLLSPAVFVLFGMALPMHHEGRQEAAGKPGEAIGAVLTRDGAGAIPIVVAEGPSASTWQAAEDLAEMIGKISGAVPEVLVGTPDPAPASAIWVGAHPLLKTVFPGQDFSLPEREEILIVSRGGQVAIVGKEEREGEVEIQSGTANAVYTFAQKFLGARWLWPGSLGEDYPSNPTIEIPETEFRFAPIIWQRDIFRNLQKFGFAPLALWCVRQRLYFDSLDVSAGHAFSNWWERYGKEHPEYFALQPDGTRGTYPENPHTLKLCEGEPAVWDQWLVEVGEQLEKNPAQRIFNAAPNDSSNSGICVDPRSTAWDHPDAEKWSYSWAKESRMGPAMTNRIVTFANILANKLREKYPGKEYFVSILGYGPTKPPPIDLEVADNVLVSYVGHFPLTDDTRRALEKDELARWGKFTKNIVYRPNITLYTGGYHGLPGVTFKNTIEDIRFLAENGCRGLVFDSLLDHWSTQGPMYYLMAQLAWDPLQNGWAVLDDYFARGFGPAAKPARAYFDLMEEAHESVYHRPDWLASGRMYKQLSEKRMLQEAWNPERLAKARALLDEAAKLAAPDPKFAALVEFIRKGFEFTENLIATMDVMNRVRESGGKDYEAVEEAQRLVAAREEFFKREKEAARGTGAIPPISEHRFKVTFLESRKVQDYVGPVSDAFLEAAAKEKANPTLPKLTAKERAAHAAAKGREFRWTGKAGDGLWATAANWEVQTPDGWAPAATPPTADSMVAFGNEADPARRAISLNANTVAQRITILASDPSGGYVIQSTDTADTGNLDSDSGMVHTLTLTDPVPLMQMFGTHAPLQIRANLTLTAENPSAKLDSTSGAKIEVIGKMTPPDLRGSRGSGGARGELIIGGKGKRAGEQ